MSSGIMQFSLATCLLATCVALGVSLECEECIDLEKNCQGKKIRCTSDKQSCGIIPMETLGQSAIMKTCVPLESCGQGPTSLNMGRAGVTRADIICCVGNDCKTEPPPLPRRNTTLNGKSCPACYALGTECKEEIAECAGNENSCFEMSRTTTIGSITAEVTMKGCANEAACYDIDHSDVSIAGIRGVHKAQCRSGSTASYISDIFGLLLPVFTGLLFAKLFA